jgi:hypothetical protein
MLNPEDQVSVFISLCDKVAQIYPHAPGSFIVAFCDSKSKLSYVTTYGPSASVSWRQVPCGACFSLCSFGSDCIENTACIHYSTVVHWVSSNSPIVASVSIAEDTCL